MKQEDWRKIEILYHSAQELLEKDRAAYLDAACVSDVALRDEVDALLAEAEKEDDFLSEPILTLGLSLLAHDRPGPLPGELLGPYRIIRSIGCGGMGEVYLAKDLRLERLVALKLLPTFLKPQALNVRRFEQEARAASGVSHPNVAHVYEIGEAEGHNYIAMEYVDGDSLRALLGGGSLGVSKAAGIALQVANALAAAHAAGIVHRDIKPENILIGYDGLVKVIDFGLAKLTEPQRASHDQRSHETQTGVRVTRIIHTEPGVLMGTANYMSPEQARGQEVDARTDIWSWGVVFYEMLAGQPPFTGATNSDVIAEILKSDPPYLQAGLPDSATLILQKALSKDKSDRYTAMPELLGDLGDLLRQLGEVGPPQLNLPPNERLVTHDGTARENARHASSQIRRLPEMLRSNQGNDLSSVPVTSSSQLAHTDAVQMLPSKSAWTLTKATIKTGFKSPLLIATGGLLVVALAFVIYGLSGRDAKPSETTLGPPRITHLTKSGRVLDAAISGDGRLLAYVPIESGKHSLWIRDLEAGGEWQLLPADRALCWGMRFTPDSQSVLYITTQPNDTAGTLYRIPVRGGPAHRLVANVNAPPAVSPDGKHIGFVRTYLAQHRDVLVVAKADGSAEREVASRQHPDRFLLSSASWSPDGKLIALGAGRNNETECAIVAVPVNSGAPFELTHWQWAAVGGVAWDNAGRTLIFSARALGSRVLQIWRLSFPDGEMQRITDDENAYEEVTWAPSANTLVATHTYEVSDIWTVNSSGAHQRLTTQGHEGADGLAVTPTGRVVYTVGEYEQSILWGMKMDGGDRKPLTDKTGFLPSASQDGRFIAYVSTERGLHHIWLMGTDGSDNKQLTDGGGENYPSVTPDGNWVVYTSIAKERGSLWKISTGGGEPIQLTRDAIYIKPVVSPDGTMIACTYRMDETDKWKIALLPFAGGAPLKTFAFPQPRYQIIRWTPDSRGLIYLDKQDGVHNLWHQPLDGSSPSQITKFTEDLILHHDRPQAGTEFVLSRGGRRRDIALIKNFK